MINCFDYDFTKNNIWDLNELKYCGKLYHYTNMVGATGIFGHADSPNLPNDCISLRFTRIDCMKKNDPEEREHINKAVKKIAKKLFLCNKIDNEFKQMILNYTPTYKGYHTLATDEIDHDFYKPQNRWLMDFGPLDYYVACFSVEPNNEHIINEFKSSVCITFNTDFSQRCTEPSSIVVNKSSSWNRVIDAGVGPYPINIIRTCNCSVYLRRVEYINVHTCIYKIQSDLLEERIIDIYKNYINIKQNYGENCKLNLETILNDIEDMYSLCDAFVKDIKYKEEKEVRLVIRLPQRKYFTEKYGSFPRLLTENQFLFDKDRKYLQLPISEEFIKL